MEANEARSIHVDLVDSLGNRLGMTVDRGSPSLVGRAAEQGTDTTTAIIQIKICLQDILEMELQ